MIHRFKLLKFLFLPIKIHLKFLQGGELTTVTNNSITYSIYSVISPLRGVFRLLEPLHSADNILFICKYYVNALEEKFKQKCTKKNPLGKEGILSELFKPIFYL